MSTQLDESRPMATPKRRAGEYLKVFFDEKDLDERTYEVSGPSGMVHIIPSAVVIETILNMPHGDERKQVASIIQKIDFCNGDLHHFLEHLAKALAARHESINGSL